MTGQEMLTVFVPSSPTAFSGYVLVVPRESVVELPLKVEEAMRLLVSGGVITPGGVGGTGRRFAAAGPTGGRRDFTIDRGPRYNPPPFAIIWRREIRRGEPVASRFG